MSTSASRVNGTGPRYHPVAQDPDAAAAADEPADINADPDAEPANDPSAHFLRGDFLRIQRNVRRSYALGAVGILFGCVGIAIGIVGLLREGMRGDGGECNGSGAKVPQYFQTSPELWAGPTPTGVAAFLAQDAEFDPSAKGGYVPNAPLQTSLPIKMDKNDESPFKLMGYLSPYTPSPGFGVDEYPLPDGADIVQVQMLSRHGARYPTTGANVAKFAERLADAKFTATGDLAFLNNWKYELGAEILVPKGRQELFDSGVLHAYMYGRLYNPNSKIIVRTTTQDRMLKSAENWMAGFFGLEWPKNATIEVIIEAPNFNNSLAGSLGCPNADKHRIGDKASKTWAETYLEKTTSRFRDMIDGFDWTAEDTYAAQTMCPYETVAYGYSRFCALFTHEEWRDFGYTVDINFAANNGFLSPTGRAIGLGWQQEMVARLKNHTLGYSGSQINTTLDSNPETFPLNQTLYFDFSHDTNIISILTAIGLRQFAGPLPATEYPGDHSFSTSHLTPFGARLDIELIQTPRPLLADRSGYADKGEETKYVHLVMNQRTIPLGASFPECDATRKDGWCELGAFLEVQDKMAELAQFDWACFGDWERPEYGEVTDGAPPVRV